MKKLFLFLSLLALLTAKSKADNVAAIITAGSVSNLVSVPFIADEITVMATSTNLTIVRFYDTATTTTSYVQAATLSYSSYNTNYNEVFTNENGIVLTNTFSGLYTHSTVVSAATNSLPAVQTIILPGNSTYNKTVHLQAFRGVSVVPDNDIVVSLDFRKNP